MGKQIEGETQHAPHATVDLSVYDWHALLGCLEEIISIRNSPNRDIAPILYGLIGSALSDGKVRVIIHNDGT